MVSITGDMSPLHPDRNLALELVRATEAASIRAVPFIGRGDKLAADAGVHVYSRKYKAAALGNITVRPDLRGRGLGKKVTARVCRELLKRTELIGLNVAAGNASAIACYRSLGFEKTHAYEEYYAKRKVCRGR